MVVNMPRKKKPPHERLEKKNVMIYLEAPLVRFAKEELPGLNISKVVTDSLIRAIAFALELFAAQDPRTWEPKRYRFQKYLQERRRILTANGEGTDSEVDEIYRDINEQLERENIPSNLI
jgi:hypothetical protein